MKEQTSNTMQDLKDRFLYCCGCGTVLDEPAQKHTLEDCKAKLESYYEYTTLQKQITELSTHNALMREALDHVLDFAEPYTPFPKQRELLNSTPSQSTTLFRNKVIQECIDKLKKDPVRTTGVTPVSEYADGFDGGFDHAIETLQTLLEKEGDL